MRWVRGSIEIVSISFYWEERGSVGSKGSKNMACNVRGLNICESVNIASASSWLHIASMFRGFWCIEIAPMMWIGVEGQFRGSLGNAHTIKSPQHQGHERTVSSSSKRGFHYTIHPTHPHPVMKPSPLADANKTNAIVPS